MPPDLIRRASAVLRAQAFDVAQDARRENLRGPVRGPVPPDLHQRSWRRSVAVVCRFETKTGPTSVRHRTSNDRPTFPRRKGGPAGTRSHRRRSAGRTRTERSCRPSCSGADTRGTRTKGRCRPRSSKTKTTTRQPDRTPSNAFGDPSIFGDRPIASSRQTAFGSRPPDVVPSRTRVSSLARLARSTTGPARSRSPRAWPTRRRRARPEREKGHRPQQRRARRPRRSRSGTPAAADARRARAWVHLDRADRTDRLHRLHRGGEPSRRASADGRPRARSAGADWSENAVGDRFGSRSKGAHRRRCRALRLRRKVLRWKRRASENFFAKSGPNCRSAREGAGHEVPQNLIAIPRYTRYTSHEPVARDASESTEGLAVENCRLLFTHLSD